MLKGSSLFKHFPKLTGLLALLVAVAAAAAVFVKFDTGPATAPNKPDAAADVKASAPESKAPPAQDANPAAMNSKGEINKLAFSRGKHIYLYEAAGGAVRRLAEGRFPSISPSGKSVAFLQDDDPRGDDSSIRILDLATGRVTRPAPLAALGAFNPRWSPGGDKLAFQALVNKRFQVGVFDPADDSVKILSEGIEAERDLGVFLDSWAADGKSLLAHSLTHVFELSLDGKVLQAFPIAKLTEADRSPSVSSATRFSFSGGKRQLLFDAKHSPEDMGIYVYDLETQRLSRLTTPDVRGADPQWLPSGNEILFTRIRKGKGPTAKDVEKLTLGDAKPVTVMRDASDASFS
jgi:Tol biopolymer transport system component